MTFALIYGTVVLTFVGDASGLDDHIVGFDGYSSCLVLIVQD